MSYHCLCWCDVIQRSKDCHNEGIKSSLQGVIKMIIHVIPLFIGFMVPDNLCNKTTSLCNHY